MQGALDSEEEETHVLCQVQKSTDKPLAVDLTIGKKPLRMEVDTGAAVSLVSETTFRSLFPRAALQPSQAKLQTYSGEPLEVLGQQDVTVSYAG